MVTRAEHVGVPADRGCDDNIVVWIEGYDPRNCRRQRDHGCTGFDAVDKGFDARLAQLMHPTDPLVAQDSCEFCQQFRRDDQHMIDGNAPEYLGGGAATRCRRAPECWCREELASRFRSTDCFDGFVDRGIGFLGGDTLRLHGFATLPSDLDGPG